MANELVLPEALRYDVIDEPLRDLEVGDEQVLQELYQCQPGGLLLRDLMGDTLDLDQEMNTRGLVDSVLGVQSWPKGDRVALGQQKVSMIKTADAFDYTGNELQRLRQIGGSSADLDRDGKSFASLQMENQRRALRRTRDVILGGLLTDSLYLKPKGNYWQVRLSSSGNAKQVKFQIPSGHKSQLGGIIGTAWNANGAKIITDKEEIFEQAGKDSGRVPTEWHMNPTTYSACFLNEGNTQLKDIGGSVNRWVVDAEMDKVRQVKKVRIKGMEDVQLHVHYRTVDFDGTMTNIFPANVISMTPFPMASWFRARAGSRLLRLPGESEATHKYGQLQYWDWKDGQTEACLTQYVSDVFLAYANEDDIWVATVIF